ncbi:hypothetical protein AK812_SmicGene39788 [Symbiodinium microadriaticum]|uniref:Uncharacterized protein n=1 Tax=Symbiodinium microadriaticum TaxID=2951 RepID=A0A1Q9CAA8_SYMMI|nr:hypothetical protein AK812_SmicGene39788 [Symbiodinium microadriaticum]
MDGRLTTKLHGIFSGGALHERKRQERTELPLFLRVELCRKRRGGSEGGEGEVEGKDLQPASFRPSALRSLLLTGPPRVSAMRRGMAARCLLLLCSSALAGKPFLIGTEDLGDTAQTCNVDAVQVANLRQLHPILHDLVNTTFFRLFRVNLKSPICPYWKSADSDKEDTSSGGTCSGTVPVLSKKPAFAQKGVHTGPTRV